MARSFQNRLNIVIAVLAIIAFLGAIAAQIVATKRTANEAIIADWTARVGNEQKNAEANTQKYKTEIKKQIALNADAQKNAESQLTQAKAKIAEANSLYARQQAEAEANLKEAELAKIKPKLESLEFQAVTCARPCFRKYGTAPHSYGQDGYMSCWYKCVVLNERPR